MKPLRRLWNAANILCAALFLACASSSSGVSSSPSGGAVPDVISQRELADPSLVGATLLDAVRRLRPRFLMDRAPSNFGAGDLLVSTDGHTLLPVSELGRITVDQVSEIRYLSAPDAAQRFGTRGTMGPVLMVTFRSR